MEFWNELNTRHEQKTKTKLKWTLWICPASLCGALQLQVSKYECTRGVLCSSPPETCLNTLFSSLSPHPSRPRRVSHWGQQTVWAQEAYVWHICLYSHCLPTADITNPSQLSGTDLASECFPIWSRHPFPNKQSQYPNLKLYGLVRNQDCLPHLLFWPL